MEIISKISKGTKMDQIYLPKNRIGFNTGTYVKINTKEKIIITKPFFYNIKEIEPIKLSLIKQIFNIVNKNIEADNIIITGSFIEKGFNFNDIDIIILTEKKVKENMIKNKIYREIKIPPHLIIFSNLSKSFFVTSN